MDTTTSNTTTTSVLQQALSPQDTKFHLFTTTNILLTLSLYIVASTLLSHLTSPKYPTTIPWVGHGNASWLSTPLNTLTSLSQTSTWLRTGYTKYSKRNQPFVLPGGVGSTAEIVMPLSQIRWMLDQPDDVLSTSAAHYDLLSGEYNFVDKVMLKDPYHEHVVHKNIARNLNGLIPEMARGQPGDVDFVVERMIGKDGSGKGKSKNRSDSEGWTSINLLEFWMNLIPRTTNRILIGEPVCQNDEYLNAVAGFMSDIVRGMLLFGLFPEVIHPVIGRLLGLIPRYHYWVSSRHSLPVIKQRLIDIQRKEEGDPEYKDWREPNDFITWTVKTARAENRPDELVPSRIAMRIMPMNFAAIHTSAITGHCAVLDILSADPGVLESLREEAARVYAEEGSQWTKQGLARMYRMDSVFRESQRYSSFAQTFVHRKVVTKEGLTTPDGVFCALGTTLVAPWYQLSQDDDLHGKAGEFDAFRYSRDREAYEALPVEERDQSDTLRLLQMGQVTTSPKHLAFGHGRHACPGRFFVSYSQKITFGHLILHYDLKPLSERPTCTWIGKNYVPSVSSRVEIQKRERTWQASQ